VPCDALIAPPGTALTGSPKAFDTGTSSAVMLVGVLTPVQISQYDRTLVALVAGEHLLRVVAKGDSTYSLAISQDSGNHYSYTGAVANLSSSGVVSTVLLWCGWTDDPVRGKVPVARSRIIYGTEQQTGGAMEMVLDGHEWAGFDPVDVTVGGVEGVGMAIMEITAHGGAGWEEMSAQASQLSAYYANRRTP